ncbi:MAG TPA: 4Fe-4S binding protein [Gammaproteobacteria bacterium]|nr:4Fe-4S binding protein [Gammaproteobacteria bacterium]
MNRIQKQRLAWRCAFFALFVLAPPLDLLRLDLTQGHFILFGQPWTLGVREASDNVQAVLNLALRAFLPLLSLVGFGLWLSWRYGRLYCGWLCPHFSVVELINALMRRASGKPTLWQREPLPEHQLDGTTIHPRRSLWLLVAVSVSAFSLLWAITLLSYLLPPAEIWAGLLQARLSPNQALFIGVATLLLMIEFTLARHLFCRYGCAVGLFQSLVWMANPRALVVGFDRRRAALCRHCDASCEHACPMRLQPRRIKRHMFACTQCQQCVQACERVCSRHNEPGLLRMLQGPCALDVSVRDFGHRPPTPPDCFPDAVKTGEH